MEERHRKKIEELMEEVQCTKDFSCVQSELKELCKIADLDWDELCKVTDLGWEDYVCLEESPPECSFASHFGDSYFCKCALRIYICKHLER